MELPAPLPDCLRARRFQPKLGRPLSSLRPAGTIPNTERGSSGFSSASGRSLACLKMHQLQQFCFRDCTSLDLSPPLPSDAKAADQRLKKRESRMSTEPPQAPGTFPARACGVSNFKRQARPELSREIANQACPDSEPFAIQSNAPFMRTFSPPTRDRSLLTDGNTRPGKPFGRALMSLTRNWCRHVGWPQHN